MGKDKITKEDIEEFITQCLIFLLASGLMITFVVGIIKLCIWVWSI